jgi:uncharacterized membrane protein YphA (DoxX/SURF4 family)
VFEPVLLAARREKIIAVLAVARAATMFAVVVAVVETSGPFAVVWGNATGAIVAYALALTLLWRLFVSTRYSGYTQNRPAAFHVDSDKHLESDLAARTFISPDNINKGI